ncbi:MAG: glycoside hydrolase family 3 C-terminal domain-containing protein [Clostridiales bacterium]|nr:glycoside hydrolase family 3 C-terminal domain-containing protein [Clostridiales bacterium]
MLPYENPALSPAERAADLTARLTLREKVGQLNQRLHGFDSYTRDGDKFALSEEFLREVERWGGLGFLYGLYRADPWSAKDFTNGLVGTAASRIYNEVQRTVMAHSRFGIPVLLCEESPHGHQALGGYLLPVNLALGCTFDPALAEEAFSVVGAQMKALHTDLALTSMLDMCRDPRWGRSEECYSEDPVLAARLAGAAVRGLRRGGMDAVAKHCAAQGETTGGVNASAARIGERELREIHLPPVRAAAEAGVSGVMAAYNEIDGVPCHGNPWLLKDVLRGEFGFDGIVMADGVAVDRLDLVSSFDLASRGATAINAGVDVSLWDRGFTALEEAVERGLVPMERIDEAVRRVLRLKFARGLFEHPFMEEGEPKVYSFAEHPETVRLARESVVLLKNKDGVLPLGKSISSLAVIGPFADDVYAQLGDYTPPQKPGASVSYLAGIRKALAGTSCKILDHAGPVPADEEALAEYIREAAEKAARVDAAVVVLGGSSSRFHDMVFEDNGAVRHTGDSGHTRNLTDCGEGVDVSDLALPLWQRRLLSAIREAIPEKPLIMILNAGRPYASDSYAPLADGLLCAFYAGPAAGIAVAEILFGDVNPSGRLSVSIPRTTGEIPAAYNRRASYDIRYADASGRPDYPFGFGLSYTEFALEDVRVTVGDESITPGDPRNPVSLPEIVRAEGITLSFRVENRGQTAGDAVPMLFVRRYRGSVIPRLCELKDFARIPLAPGASALVTLRLPPDALEVLGADSRRRIEPGALDLLLYEGEGMRWRGTAAIR